MYSDRVKKQLLAQLLRETLEKAGFTQRQMAKKMKKHQTSISRILLAKQNITALELLDWCLVCNVSWKSLLESIEQSESTKVTNI